MKTIAIAQARMGSTRVPGKVMRLLNGKPILRWTLDALSAVRGIDNIILATSTAKTDDSIVQYCTDERILYYRGHQTDVLDRLYQCAKVHEAEIILRLTCDCPFLDPKIIEEVIRLREMIGADYASNIDPPTYPDGLDVECFTFEALEAAWKETTSSIDRDCAPQFIVRNRNRFKAANLTCPLPGLARERWVLDTEEDWLFCQEIAAHIPLGKVPSYLDILAILDKYPKLRLINQKWTRNERFYEGLAEEILLPRQFRYSEEILAESLKTIPFGTQTFSKSHIQFPAGRAPLYCMHGDGGYLFDVDGNRYVDLVNAILPIILGYRDPDVNEAIRRQLDNGISFSLGTPLEGQLAEAICHYVPCAEMVKFGKSGTDVTTAAIRLARAYTRREHIFLSGYHGWADWSMACTDRNLGIPHSVRNLSHRFTYGNKAEVLQLGNDYQPAAIIVEPNDNPIFLKWLRQFCHNRGIVLIFDEIITGFRYSMGGAQKLFDVKPDMATFGKAMANGMPISALVGRKDLMKMMEPPGNIFYSGTMFGETLSIAAAIATIKKLDSKSVIPHLWNMGERLTRDVTCEIGANNLAEHIKISGHYPRTLLDFRGEFADQIRTIFMTEMIQNGVLIINSNNLSFGHQEPEYKRIITAYAQTFKTIADSLKRGDIHKLAGEIVAAAPLRASI